MATLTGQVDSTSSSKYLTATLTYTTSTTDAEHTLTLQSLTIKAVGVNYFYGNYRIYYGGSLIMTLSSNTNSTLAAGKSATIGLDFAASTQKTARTTSTQSKELAIYRAPQSAPSSYAKKLSTNISVAAKPSYTISYNGNGATSGSMTASTKWYNTNLTLKTNTFTRTNYSFTKWNTQANGNGTNYGTSTGGGTYTANAAATMYAQWTQVYATPQISVTKAYRCNSQGIADDEGKYAKVVGTYSIWNTSTANSVSTASGKVPVCTVNSVSQTAASGSGDVDNTYSTPIASGNWMRGQFVFKVDADMSTDSSYSVSVSFTDTQGGTTGRTTATGTGAGAIGTAFYTIDILEGGHGIAFGGTARDDGVMGLWMPIRQYIGNNYSVAPSSDSYFDVLVDYDKAGNQIGYMAINNMTNNVYRSFAVTNPRSSASNKTAGLYLTVRDDGTKSFTTNGVPLAVNSGGTGITDFASFNYVNGSNVSVANNPTSYARLATIPLTAGKWLILVGCYAAYAATGSRIFTVSSATSVTGVAGRGVTAQLNSAASTCYTTIPWILNLGSATTYYVYGWQNSGAALNMSAYVIYTKLG